MKIKEWLLEEYRDEPGTIKDIAEHGCISGVCSSLIYYQDTTEFYDTHRTEIWEMMNEDARNMGMHFAEFLTLLTKQTDEMTEEQFNNILVWYAVERRAQEIVEEREIGDC